MATLGKIFGGLILLVLFVIFGVYFYIDSITKSVIEEESTKALGVPTHVGSVRTGILSGKFAMSNFDIDNPEGFSTPDFFKMKHGQLSVGLPSLMEETVDIEEVVLSDIDVYLERQVTKTNYGVILDNVGKSEKQQPEPSEDASGKTFVIQDFRILNVTAHLQLGAGGTGTGMEVLIPEIRMKKVGSDTWGGVFMSELTGIVIKSVLDALARSGKLPGNLGLELLGGLRGLDKVPVQIVGEVKRIGLETATDAAKGLVGGTAEEVEEKAKKALEGLGGLIKRD